uniref:Protein LSM12 homolog n=1 Tax=Cacopsylla melanoneura TaxID=428564 RepID=A0A8D8W1P6_9HEMI
MAGLSDCFTIGSIVSCQTCHSEIIEGEVVAFEPHTKTLILKCPASDGKPNLNDVHIINLSFVSDVQVKKEVTTLNESSPPSLNLARIQTRLKNSIEEKKRLVSALAAGVSLEGRQLFITITKTMPEVSWEGKNIVIMNEVTITPPYKPENVKGQSDSKAYIHVRKMVEKHLKDIQSSALSTNNSLDSSHNNNISISSSISSTAAPH